MTVLPVWSLAPYGGDQGVQRGGRGAGIVAGVFYRSFYRDHEAKSTFTIETYQHVLPGMQTDAARTFENLIAPSVLPEGSSTAPTRLNTRENTA